MTDYVLRTITKPEEGSATVFKMSKKGVPMFKGEGSDNYLCETCKNILAKNVFRKQLVNLVLVCPKCDSYNLLEGT